MLQPGGILVLTPTPTTLPPDKGSPREQREEILCSQHLGQDSFSSLFLASVLLWPRNGHPSSGRPLPGSRIFWLSIRSLLEERVNRDSEHQTC